MINKLKYKFIFLLVIVLIVSLFISTSCGLAERLLWKLGYRPQDNIRFDTYEEKEEDLSSLPPVTPEIIEEFEEAELLEGSEEEERLIPNEPITYSGDALGLAVVLVVNFKTKVVTGSISLSGDDYVDATITDGKINIETFEITANFSGIMGSAEYDQVDTFNGIITGKVSEDLNTFNGDIRDDEGDGGKFTINK